MFNELYQQFIRLYVLNHSFRRETIDYYHGGQSADFDFNLNNHLRDKLNYNYNRIRNNRDINHNINIELDIQNEQNDDQKNLFDKYKNHHEKNLENIPEDTNPEDIDDLSKVQEILDKYNKKLDKLEKKVNKDLENRVDWTQERMKQKNRSKFKIWLQTPNPQTRHNSNDGQIVPLDEKFIIVNDKTGDIDYLDYPGDSKGSIGNIANCLCTLGFDKDITPEQLRKYKDYKTQKQSQIKKSKKIINDNALNKILRKNRTHRSINDWDKYVSQKEIIKLFEEHKHEFPPEFSEKTIKNYIKLQQVFKKDANEHCFVIDIDTGDIYNPMDGKEGKATLYYGGTENVKCLGSGHNHPRIGFNSPSSKDMDSMLKNEREKYCVVVSESKIWIVQNKYYGMDLRKENNKYEAKQSVKLCSAINDAHKLKEEFKLKNHKSLKTLNTKIDKKFSKILDEYNFNYWIINI